MRVVQVSVAKPALVHAALYAPVGSVCFLSLNNNVVVQEGSHFYTNISQVKSVPVGQSGRGVKEAAAFNLTCPPHAPTVWLPVGSGCKAATGRKVWCMPF